MKKQIALENLELKQKAAEEFNKIELSRLGMHLKVAEKRQSELESQKADILSKIKNTDISFYKSNFYDKLQSILDNDVSFSDTSFVVSSQQSDALKSFSKSLNELEKSCSRFKTKKIYKQKVLPLLNVIKNSYEKLQKTIETTSYSSSDSES